MSLNFLIFFPYFCILLKSSTNFLFSLVHFCTRDSVDVEWSNIELNLRLLKREHCKEICLHSSRNLCNIVRNVLNFFGNFLNSTDMFRFNPRTYCGCHIKSSVFRKKFGRYQKEVFQSSFMFIHWRRMLLWWLSSLSTGKSCQIKNKI